LENRRKVTASPLANKPRLTSGAILDRLGGWS
jgi:hypothetical protein